MPDIALYYPYTHVRDEAWLKAAALYLPKLALLVPPGYPRRRTGVTQANGMAVVTDQPFAYGTLNGWGLDTLARALLTDDVDEPAAGRHPDQVAALYAALAVQAVVPDGLADVPVERIVAARRALAAEFDAFCAHLDRMGGKFADLARIEDRAVLDARLEGFVRP